MNRKRLFASGIPILFFLLLFSAPQNNSMSIANPTPTISVAAEMEPAPTDCGPYPEAVQITKFYGTLLGSWPLWGTISIGQSGVLGMSKDHPTDEVLPGWWVQKVLWLVSTSYKGEVKIRGYNLADNSSIFFSFNNNPPVMVGILDPDNPGAFAEGSDQFANFPSGTWVSKAGCYTLEAQWDGGLWSQTIAVGYVEGQ